MTHDARTARVEVELSTGWGKANPELFVDAVVRFQADYPITEWSHRIDLARHGFVTLTADRKPAPAEAPKLYTGPVRKP